MGPWNALEWLESNSKQKDDPTFNQITVLTEIRVDPLSLETWQDMGPDLGTSVLLSHISCAMTGFCTAFRNEQFADNTHFLIHDAQWRLGNSVSFCPKNKWNKQPRCGCVHVSFCSSWCHSFYVFQVFWLPRDGFFDLMSSGSGSIPSPHKTCVEMADQSLPCTVLLGEKGNSNLCTLLQYILQLFSFSSKRWQQCQGILLRGCPFNYRSWCLLFLQRRFTNPKLRFFGPHNIQDLQ